jgi:hypothetical protein
MKSKNYFELETECPGFPERDWEDESEGARIG